MRISQSKGVAGIEPTLILLTSELRKICATKYTKPLKLRF